MEKVIEINSSDDFIDVRDIIERVEQLEGEIKADEISEDNGAKAQRNDDGSVVEDIVTCETCGKSWNDALISERTPAPSARCPYEYLHDEIEELSQLNDLLEDLCGNGGDHEWRGDWYPISLIRESHFEDYAQELAEDIGAISSDAKWPNNCINWEQAANELLIDYTSTEFEGVTFYYR
jgi:hypothetical protein